MARRRLDAELVRRGLAASRLDAAAAVRAGNVTVGGAPASTPAALVAAGVALSVSAPRDAVSRGGAKLQAALDRFAIEPAGLDCLDAGSSTGGFTQCLLRAGAARVLAVDVGYGLLDWSLRQDERVTVLERTNVRSLDPERLPFVPSLVVADLSFVSLRSVVADLARVGSADARFVVLVKPPFEVARGSVEPGGVVRDPAAWRAAIEGVAEACRAVGLAPVGVMASPVLGPAGNVEFPLLAAAGVGVADAPDLGVAAAVAEGEAVRR